MRKVLFIPFLGALLGLMAGSASASAGRFPAGVDGIWLNPTRSVAVQTGSCGANLCGHVVWASAEAKTDAQDSGIASLLGTQLLQDYHPRGHGVWEGVVYVPDMGRRFSSQIQQVSPSALKIKGCVLGGLLCKSQIWTRIGQMPS